MKVDPEMVKEAGLKTFEFAAPLILVGTVAAMWHAYGWIVGAICALGYLVAATLAWRAAWLNYRKRNAP